jgi:hypothetical protein
MRQILTPLVAVYPDPAFCADLIRYFGAYAKEERSEGVEAIFVTAIKMRLGGKSSAKITLQDISLQAGAIRQSQESTDAQEAIKRQYRGADLPVVFTSRAAGAVVRSMGLIPWRAGKGYGTIEITQDRLAELEKRFPPVPTDGVVTVGGRVPTV